MTWEFGRIVLLCLLYLPWPIRGQNSSNKPQLVSPKVLEKKCVFTTIRCLAYRIRLRVSWTIVGPAFHRVLALSIHVWRSPRPSSRPLPGVYASVSQYRKDLERNTYQIHTTILYIKNAYLKSSNLQNPISKSPSTNMLKSLPSNFQNCMKSNLNYP